MRRLRSSLLVLAAGLLSGQTGGKPPAFEAASVKIADRKLIPGITFKMAGGPGTSDPGRITYTQIRLLQLLMRAWDVESYRIAGPAWLTSPDAEWYNITATMPPETTRQQFHEMLQNLLVERFQMRLHHEIRDFPGYELTVAPGGPKLREPANADAPEPSTGPSGKSGEDGFLILPPGHGKGVRMASNGVYAKFQNCTVDELVEPYLSSFIQQSTGATTNHIVDKTGLTGRYDFTLKFDARNSSVRVVSGIGAAEPPAPGTASEPSGLPGLFTALEKQLGLKLVKVKAFPLDTMVIDHIEKAPTEN